MIQTHIRQVKGREILDSRGNPTVEAEVVLSDGTVGRGIAPSGASTGQFEALELRDGETTRYQGKGVRNAVRHVSTTIYQAVNNMDAADIYGVDAAMLYADGSEDKSKLGANAILAVSIACADAAAKSLKLPLYRFLGGLNARVLPVPMMNIINGGAHAKNNIDFQEFMIVPIGADSFKQALRMGAEVYHCLKKLLEEQGKVTSVGDEGGFAPDFQSMDEIFAALMEAVQQAGYEPGKEIAFSLDVAASEFYDKEEGLYMLSRGFLSQKQAVIDKEAQKKGKIPYSAAELIQVYEELCAKYPIFSIEDPLDEEDWEGWKEISKKLGDRVKLVGDDLFVTNRKRLERGIKEGCGNSILIKPNQIGSLSETLETVRKARDHGFMAILSHRSGETEDTTIADLAVALNVGFIKTGAPCRSERVAKYNRLLRIEEELGKTSVYGLLK